MIRLLFMFWVVGGLFTFILQNVAQATEAVVNSVNVSSPANLLDNEYQHYLSKLEKLRRDYLNKKAIKERHFDSLMGQVKDVLGDLITVLGGGSRRLTPEEEKMLFDLKGAQTKLNFFRFRFEAAKNRHHRVIQKIEKKITNTLALQEMLRGQSQKLNISNLDANQLEVLGSMYLLVTEMAEQLKREYILRIEEAKELSAALKKVKYKKEHYPGQNSGEIIWRTYHLMDQIASIDVAFRASSLALKSQQTIKSALGDYTPSEVTLPKEQPDDIEIE